MRFSRFRRLVAGPPVHQSETGGTTTRMVKLLGRRAEGWIPFVSDEGRDDFERAVRMDPLGVPIGIELPGGLTYVSTGSGMFELVIKSIRAFVNGEAWEVGVTLWMACEAGVAKLESTYKVVSVVLAPLRFLVRVGSILGLGRLGGWFGPLVQRFSLGFSLVGSMSFVTLLITSSLMMPFQLANNVRIGRG